MSDLIKELQKLGDHTEYDVVYQALQQLVENRLLFVDILEYIETMERMKEWEWGECRDLEEMIDGGKMPSLYYKVREAGYGGEG